MKNFPSFLVGVVFGAVIGAVVALIYAPSSGEELRLRIGQEAEAERDKLQAGYEKARHQVQERVETMQHHQEAESEQDETEETAVEG